MTDLDALTAGLRDRSDAYPTDDPGLLLHRAADAIDALRADWETEHDKWLNAECDLTQARKERDAARAELAQYHTGGLTIGERILRKQAEDLLAENRALWAQLEAARSELAEARQTIQALQDNDHINRCCTEACKWCREIMGEDES